MEESKNLQGLYTAFRIAIYVSLVAEVFEYAIPPGLLEPLGSWLMDIQERMGRWFIYQQGHLPYSKIATILLVAITCIGTKNKKQLEFNARKMVFWPLFAGLILLIFAIWMYNTRLLSVHLSVFKLSIWLYIITSVIGTVAIHVALDNVSKYLKDALSVIEDEEIIINFRDSVSPCVIKPLKGEKYSYLILPIRMN